MLKQYSSLVIHIRASKYYRPRGDRRHERVRGESLQAKIEQKESRRSAESGCKVVGGESIVRRIGAISEASGYTQQHIGDLVNLCTRRFPRARRTLKANLCASFHDDDKGK